MEPLPTHTTGEVHPSNRVKGLVKMLNPEFNPEHYEDAQFLGRGTCTVSQVFYTSPSHRAAGRRAAPSPSTAA